MRDNMQLCDYGCGKEATHQFKNGKWCCSREFQSCPEMKKQFMNEKNKNNLKILRNNYKKIKTDNLCEYGCGQKAKYILNNEKICCEPYYSKCKAIRIKNSNGNKGKEGNRKGHAPWNKGKKDVYTKETLKKISSGARNTIKYIKEKYLFFSKIEEMRYNPDILGEIQVHCKNHNCKNSKEKGGWFTPTRSQINERRRCLEHQGIDYSCFYCSQKCKNECPLYGKKGADPFKDQKLPYTYEELQAWKNKVKELDDSKCQICESTENIHVHHIIPQKLEPFFALDPINGICLCKECHYKYGHKDECSTSNIAHKQCNNMR